MSRDTGKDQISRAVLEGITLSIDDLFTSLSKDSGIKIKEMNVDGGAVENSLLCQIQSSFSKLNILRPTVIEVTAYGAARRSNWSGKNYN